MHGYATAPREWRGILLLLLALASFLIAACSDDDNGSAAPTIAAETEAVAAPATEQVAEPASQAPAPQAAEQNEGMDSQPSQPLAEHAEADPLSPESQKAPQSQGTNADADAAFPVTLVDDDGNSFTLEAPPQRIAAVLPSVVDLVLDLGGANLIVGADDFSLDRVPQAESIGGYNFVYNLEALARLEPDLVLAAQDGTEALRLGVRELELPLFVVDFPTSLDEVLEQLGTLGQLLGVSDAADALVAELRDRANAVVAKTAGHPPLRVYLEIDQSTPTQPFTVGPGSLHQQILELAGGVNIFADATADFPQVNWEAIIIADPEVILLLDSKEFADELAFNPVSIEEVGQRTGWDLITAVREGQIVPLPPDLFSVGAGLLDALERVAQVLEDARATAGAAP